MAEAASPYAHEDDCTWYLAHARDKEAGPYLIALCRELRGRQRDLIGNTDKCIAVFQWGGDAKDMDPGENCPIEDNLCTFNAAQNGVETVFAKVIKSRIAPMPLTTGGGYLARYRAKQLGKALEGVMDDNDCDIIEEDVVMDALVTDHAAGAIRVIEGEDRVKLEHVPIEDVWYDEAEIRQRQPRSQFHIPRHGIDKYVLIELFASEETRDRPGFIGTPETRRAAIMAAASRPEAWRTGSLPGSAHRVDYFESWHLASGDVEDADEEYVDEETGETKTRKVCRHDGRHVVAVEGEHGTLVDEPWAEDHFPILLYVPRRRRRSIWGLSLMRDWTPLASSPRRARRSTSASSRRAPSPPAGLPSTRARAATRLRRSRRSPSRTAPLPTTTRSLATCWRGRASANSPARPSFPPGSSRQAARRSRSSTTSKT